MSIEIKTKVVQEEEVAKKNNMNILFVEKGGHSLVNVLGEADPFREEKCGRECFPCQGGKRKSRCDVRGAAYEIRCMEEGCLEKNLRYFGECARSAYTRGKDHWRGYQAGNKENPLWKHAKAEHGDVKFEMEVVGCYGRDNMRRRTNEAVRIEESEGVNLNSKAEFNQPMLPRARIQRNVNRE